MKRKVLFIENCMNADWMLIETSATAEMIEEFLLAYEDGAANVDLLGERKILKCSDMLPATESIYDLPESDETIYIDIR